MNGDVINDVTVIKKNKLFSLTSAIVTYKPDIIHVNAVWEHILAAYIAAKLLKVPLVLRPAGTFQFQSSTIMRKLFNKFYFSIIAKYAKIIYLFSPGEKEFYTWTNNIKLIVNGIDSEKMTEYKTVYPDNSIKLLYVGNIKINKGFLILADAVKLLIKDYNDISIDVVGNIEESERKSITQYLVDNEIIQYFKLHGRKDKSEVYRFYKNTDILISPSLSEGFPNVLIEAMGTGMCVVASDIEINSLIIENMVDGLIFSRNDHSDLAEKVSTLYKNRQLIKQFGIKAREKVLAKYVFENNVGPVILNDYRKLMENDI